MTMQQELTQPNVIRLQEEIARMSPGGAATGKRAETLIKSDQMRVVLVTMEPKAMLHEHAAPGPITIHVLSGSFVVRVGSESFSLGSGQLLPIEPRVRHDVEAVEAGAFLLTISWPNRMPGDPAIGAY